MFPKTGNKRHHLQGDLDFAMLIAEALNAELGPTHRAVKTAMRWTGASERSVKHWLAGTHAPCGSHLVGLVRHSDRLLSTFLGVAGRSEVIMMIELTTLRSKLAEVIDLIDRQITDEGH